MLQCNVLHTSYIHCSFHFTAFYFIAAYQSFNFFSNLSFLAEMSEKVLIGLTILVILKGNVRRSSVRGKIRKWIARRYEKGLQSNYNVELSLEDTKMHNETT